MNYFCVHYFKVLFANSKYYQENLKTLKNRMESGLDIDIARFQIVHALFTILEEIITI